MINELKGGFKILTSEVLQAAKEAQSLLNQRDAALSQNLYHRVAYITTQVALIQNQTLDLAVLYAPDRRQFRFMQGLSSIASRLERISDMFLNLDRQAGYLSDPEVLNEFNLDEFFNEIQFGLNKIFPALTRQEVGLAVRLGQTEEKLDTCYADRFSHLIREFVIPSRASDLVTILMIIHYLERIGDILLEIGEKIIYVILGEKMKLEQYKALGAGLKAAGKPAELERLDFHSIWGGRSGCRIGVVSNPETAETNETVLFKHGPAFKLTRERENLELWSSLRPGLTPEVKAFIPARAGAEAALMMEFIPFPNLQAMFMENVIQEAQNGLKMALDIMCSLWRESKTERPSQAEFSRQVENRLAEVATLYPTLINHYASIGRMEISSIPRLLSSLREMETGLTAPYTMRIHGDFNLSNLIYNHDDKRLHVIDLYRSRETDYVQDVSVMLVSIIRLPIFEPKLRNQLTQIAFNTATMIENFSMEITDPTYNARLALGLARSFLTSTRFELHESMATRFVTRARYLWEKLLRHGQSGQPWSDFNFSLEILNLL